MKQLFYLILCAGLMFFAACTSQPAIEFQKNGQKITVMTDGKMITEYVFDSTLSRPVLHPLFSPSGAKVTRDYPFRDIEGESHEHPHHTGVYFTYGSDGEVNGNSFWYNPHDRPPFSPGIKLPGIHHQEITGLETSNGKGTITAMNHWVDSTSTPLLEEHRIMEFKVEEQAYIIDFTITLRALDTKVTFGDTKEGMFAIRVADWLAEEAKGTLYEGTGEYLNAEGDRTEENVWGKRSAWVRLQGEKEGTPVGVAVFHHPSGLNYPAYWHARGYGCFGANPIGQATYQRQRKHAVENPQERTLTLQPDEKALFKFRMLVYEGNRGLEEMAAEFERYSKS